MSKFADFDYLSGKGGMSAWQKGIENFIGFKDYVFSSSSFADSISAWAKYPDNPLILYGSYGVGKTELATRLPYYMEQNFHSSAGNFVNCAASSTKLFDILERVYVGINGTPYFLFDEADALSEKQQKYLRCEVERSSKHANFVFCTNDLSLIDTALRDRSLVLNVTLSSENLLEIALRMLRDKNIQIAPLTLEKMLDKTRCFTGRDVKQLVKDISLKYKS